MNVVNNARKDLDAEIARKRKEMRAAHKTVIVAEDEPSVYKQELHKRAVKVNEDEFHFRWLMIDIFLVIC